MYYYCPACDSSDLQLLGSLGGRDHLRCDCCGITFSHENTEENDDEFWDEYSEPDESDDSDALASAGFGTDEDYGSFSDNEEYYIQDY